MKKVFGLIEGENADKSLSPFIHQFFGCKDYAEYKLNESGLKRFLTEKNFFGVNVTAPYKKRVIEHLDELSPRAEKIGAVNTIVNDGNKLKGYNTDYFGVKFLFDFYGVKVKNKTVLILGDGGVSSAIKTFCLDFGAKEIIIKKRKETYLCNKDGTSAITDFDKEKSAQIIVNATPVGEIKNDEPPLIDLNEYKKVKAVFDMIYRPFLPPLIRQAKEKKIIADGGLIPLVAQAVKSAEYFYGVTYSNKQILNLIKKVEFYKKNVVLTGFSCAGKTTVGKALAKTLNREFIDTDELIEKTENKSVNKIIEENGEEYFREKEKKAIANLYGKTGAVISLGGGVVIDKDNIDRLKGNGKIVYIKRKLNKDDLEKRLIFSDFNYAKTVYKLRKPLYNDCCDKKVSNNGKIEKTVNKIIKGLK